MNSKKQKLLQQIENSEKISDKEKELIKNKFLNYIKRTGANKEGTQANYLQASHKIAAQTDTDLDQLQELSEEQLLQLNEEVADKIQASQFRVKKGETSQRRKRHLWATWKKILQTQGIATEKHRGHIPAANFSTNKAKVNRQADTRPDDLPTPQQMKKYVETLRTCSGETTALRNQAMVLLLWDKGPRIGEALNLNIGDIHVNGNTVKISITGNKKAKDRTVEMFQGRKTLIDYIEQHPEKENSEAYLFTKLKTGNHFEQLSKPPLRRKIIQAKKQGGYSFKTFGEPFHIFRKAMITSHIVNEWATWEEICTWHGTKTDSRKPDYLKMALSDVDSNVAEKMGVENSKSRESENRMKGDPLLPKKCLSCDKLNRCYKEICQYCGSELPESKMPKNTQTEDMDNAVTQEEINRLKKEIEEMSQKVGKN